MSTVDHIRICPRTDAVVALRQRKESPNVKYITRTLGTETTSINFDFYTECNVCFSHNGFFVVKGQRGIVDSYSERQEVYHIDDGLTTCRRVVQLSDKDGRILAVECVNRAVVLLILYHISGNRVRHCLYIYHETTFLTNLVITDNLLQNHLAHFPQRHSVHLASVKTYNPINMVFHDKPKKLYITDSTGIYEFDTREFRFPHRVSLTNNFKPVKKIKNIVLDPVSGNMIASDYYFDIYDVDLHDMNCFDVNLHGFSYKTYRNSLRNLTQTSAFGINSLGELVTASRCGKIITLPSRTLQTLAGDTVSVTWEQILSESLVTTVADKLGELPEDIFLIGSVIMFQPTVTVTVTLGEETKQCELATACSREDEDGTFDFTCVEYAIRKIARMFMVQDVDLFKNGKKLVYDQNISDVLCDKDKILAVSLRHD